MTEQTAVAGNPGASAAARNPRSGAAWRWFAALLLVGAGGGAGWWWTHRPPPPARFATAPVTVGAITRTITSTGTVNPELTIIVGTYVSGVIQQLTCDFNTKVRKGQVCAKIDPRPYQTVVDQAKASLAIARAQLEKDQASLTYARQSFERAERLVQSAAVSRDAFDSARSAFDQAKAQVLFDEATIQHRQAALAAAQVDLDYTDIVSPVDGTVVSRNVTIGQTVAASFQTPTLFLIATDLTKMQVDTNVSESDIGGVRKGDAATFTVDAWPKRVFAGKVREVRQSPQTIQNVVTYDVVVGVDNADLALLPGMTAASRIVLDERKGVPRAPNQALRYTPPGAPPLEEGMARVWVLREGSPVAVLIEPGLDDENFTEIVSGGLKPGDRVITGEQTAPAGSRGAPRPRL